MEKYFVFYQKDPASWQRNPKHNLTMDNLQDTHTYIATIMATDKEDAFFQMQGENWSPNGEAYPLIKTLNLHHTSMFTGDVLVHAKPIRYTDGGKHWELTGYLCEMIGWTQFE